MPLPSGLAELSGRKEEGALSIRPTKRIGVMTKDLTMSGQPPGVDLSTVHVLVDQSDLLMHVLIIHAEIMGESWGNPRGLR